MDIGHTTGKTGDYEEVTSKWRPVLFTDDDKQEGACRENGKDQNKELRPIPISSPSSPSGRKKDSIFNNENKNEVKLDCFPTIIPPEGLVGTSKKELTLENNARYPHVSEDRFLKGKSVEFETSPAFRKTLLNKDKGKGKVLPEVNSCKEMSKEEDDNVQIVDSCNNVDFPGRKRDRFEQNVTSNSKRVKTQVQENPSWNSRGYQGNSFMNYFSNMWKVSDSRIDETKKPSLAPTTPKESHVGKSRDRVGDFTPFFQSLCRSKQKEMETKATIEKSSIGECNNEVVLVEREAGPGAKPISSSGTHGKGKLRIEVDNKFDSLRSLWVTRFSGKSDEHLVNVEGPSSILKKAHDKTNEMQTIESASSKSKAFVSSMIAKRINALKHIAAQDNILTTCFYCGKVGHDLRNCLDIEDTHRDIIGNISSYDISCPKALTFKEKTPSQFNIGTSAALAIDDSGERGVLPEVPKGTYDVIRMLRLSRSNILKFMNTHSSLSSLNGFFLRVLVKKSGRLGYYAARISDEQREEQLQGSIGPIAVNLEDTCFLINSKHISNQDFADDEITKWLSTTARRGGTIPSGEDLKAKLEEKMRLGF